MINTLLIEILRTFTSEELNRFTDLINSPYFNKKSSLIIFFGELKKFAPEFKDESLNRESLWKVIYPGKDFNYGTMKNLVYDLHKLVERFLTEEIFDTDSIAKDYYLLRNLKDKSLSNVYSKVFRKALKTCENIGEFDKSYYWMSELHSLSGEYKFFQSPKKIDFKIFIKSSEYYIYSVLIKLTRQLNATISGGNPEETLVKKFLESFDLKPVMRFIQKSSSKDYKKINFFYKRYLSLTNPDKPELYFVFKDYLIENDHFLSKEERFNLYTSLITALNSLRYDSALKIKEFNNLDKLRLEKNVLINYEGNLSPIIYSSIVMNAGKLRDIEFLDNFINIYYKKLPDEYKENMYNFGMAYLMFAKRQFPKALEYICKVKLDIDKYKYYTRSLQLMIYYELKDEISFTYAKENFRHFLSNGDLQKEIYYNFVKYTEKLLKLREHYNNETYLNLKNEIIHLEKLSNKNWLLEKIEELK